MSTAATVPRYGWRRIHVAGVETARLACPQCKQWATLQHSINMDGVVFPKFICPVDSCSFGDYVQLAGWQQRDAVGGL